MANEQDSLKRFLVAQIAFWIRLSLISPILAIFIRSRVSGISVADIGLLMMAGAVGWAIFEPIFGTAAYRIGRKRLWILSIVMTSLLYLAYIFATDIWHFYLLEFALASSLAEGSVSLRAATIDVMPREGRGKIYGRFMAVVAMGQAIGPFIGGFLADTLGNTAPFYLCSGLSIVSLVALLLMKSVDVQETQESPSIVTSARTLDHGLFTKSLLSLLLVRMLFIFNFNFQRGILPIFLSESNSFHASETQIGIYMGSISFASALSQVFLGGLADRIGDAKLMTLGLFASGLSYACLIVLNGALSLYFLGVFQGIFFAASEISMMIRLMGITPRGSSSRVMGFYGLSEDIGGIISSPSLGLVYDRIGSMFALLCMSIILIFNSVLSVSLLRVNHRNEPMSATDRVSSESGDSGNGA